MPGWTGQGDLKNRFQPYYPAVEIIQAKLLLLHQTNHLLTPVVHTDLCGA